MLSSRLINSGSLCPIWAANLYSQIKYSMKNLFIGIDVSKDTLDYSVIDAETHSIVLYDQIENTAKGINAFIKYLNKQFTGLSVKIFAEHTGHYGYLLATHLHKKGLSFYLINPLDLKRSLGISRGKTDRKDAYRIASYGISNVHKLREFELPSNALRELNSCITTRDSLVKMSVQAQNTLKAKEIEIKSGANVKFIIRKLKSTIKHLKKQITDIKKHMDAIIAENSELKKTVKKITSVIGIGPITAYTIIAATHNFTKFSDGRKFSCHCGVVPFQHQSGTSVRGKSRTSSMCNKKLKTKIFNCVNTAILHDPQLKKYYERKLEEGKDKCVVKTAVANKLILRVFAVAKRDTPYIPLHV